MISGKTRVFRFLRVMCTSCQRAERLSAMLMRTTGRPIAALLSAAAGLFTAAASFAAVSEQIIVDQIRLAGRCCRGRSRSSPIPITGQNSAVAYTPGATLPDPPRQRQCHRLHRKRHKLEEPARPRPRAATRSGTAISPPSPRPATTTSSIPPTTSRATTSSSTTPSSPTCCKASARTFYYQRCGTAISTTYGGNWNHPICHTGSEPGPGRPPVAQRRRHRHRPRCLMAAGTTPAT